MNQRQISLKILIKTIKDESYSNLLMRNELNKLEPIERKFCTELVNGVLRNYEFLEYQYKDEIKESTSLKNKIILSMALYERFYLKKQDYVVNHEYVELADSKFDKSFINAVLRKINSIKEPKEDNVKYSLPKWIYSLLSSQYDEPTLRKIINVYHKVPSVYYRINKSKVSMDRIKANVIDDDFFTSDNNLLISNEFKKGYYYVQDYNSGQLYKHLDLQANNTLLDVCSAPGSKLFNCLDIVKSSNAYANDIHPNRVELIKKAANRLGFNDINYLNYDGLDINNHLDIKFDRILLDAPCSGLGVIGRKPDLKFHIKPNSLDELEKLQADLLDCISLLLADNGILLYSTCTLNKKENARQIIKFIDRHPDFKVLEEDTIINDMGDCFYYCKLTKV